MDGSALLLVGRCEIEAVQIVRHLRHRDGRVMVLVRRRDGRYTAVEPGRLITRDRMLFV